MSAPSSVRTTDLPSGSADAKDRAGGLSQVHDTVGLGGAADAYRFDFSGTVSPVDSWLGDRVGTLHLDALRAAHACKSFSLAVATHLPSRTVLLNQAAGDGATAVDLYFGETCEQRLSDRMDVPGGIDPPFSQSVGGTVTAVPEPATAAWLPGGLVVVVALARQRTTKPS